MAFGFYLFPVYSRWTPSSRRSLSATMTNIYSRHYSLEVETGRAVASGSRYGLLYRLRLHYDARLDGCRGACVIEDRREADDLGLGLG